MSDLANRVAAIIPGKWMEVAIQLEIRMGAIDAVRGENRKCFQQFMAILDIMGAIFKSSIHLEHLSQCLEISISQ
ncbi:hypothetical protein GBAR_LOCUS12685 [Geodia barretti]|uniref:Uncharacterized protein n=1 Tax=Geodia barretti TaxID=519541 RepID=A0AA35WHB5_GEOBA|nr:hypothetical protein GBAR_LOCUS12685 [Geodia barretti]